MVGLAVHRTPTLGPLLLLYSPRSIIERAMVPDSNVLEPTAEPLGRLVAHAENLSRFIGSFSELAQTSARVGYMSGHLIAAADDVLNLFRETAQTLRTHERRDLIDPEDRLTSELAALEEQLSASVRTLDDAIETQGARADVARVLRRLSAKLREIFEEGKGLRIYILEHDADADQETAGPFKTAASLIGALRE